MKYTRRQIVEALDFWKSLLASFRKREAPDFGNDGDEVFGPAFRRAIDEADIPGVEWFELDVDANTLKVGLAPGVRGTNEIRQALKRTMSAVQPVDVWFDGLDGRTATFTWQLESDE